MRAVTVAVFLDYVHEFNGPIYFIPGSHREGCLDRDLAGVGAWHEHVAAALRYQTAEDNVSWLVLNHGLVTPKGPRGSVLFFDSNIVHASPANISPFERRIVFITYNSIHNLPRNTSRPAFLVNRYMAPLQPLDNEGDDVESTTALARELA
jgi:ectoine hydroxylase